MLIRLGLTLIALALLPQPRTNRVFLMSFDGLGHERLTTDPVAQELTTLQAMRKTGAHADGLTPAFPSTTANSHAALWTGTYAGRNGIIYNSTPPLPRAEHRFTDRIVGFRSESLTAEPIWLTASRQGIPVVAHQMTQVFPFTSQTVGTQPSPNLLVSNGFQSRSFARWRAVRSGDDDVSKTSCQGWKANVAGAACYAWSLGKEANSRGLVAAVLRDRILIATAAGATPIEVWHQPTETESPKHRELARYWSKPLAIEGLPGDSPASLMFRALEIDPQTGSFLLLQSPLQETAMHSNDAGLARAMVADTGAMVGNGASSLYSSGRLGTPALSGGSGEAERRYLETLELVVKQQIAQSTWLFKRRSPRLHLSYISTADDIDHTWYGLDRAGDKRYTEYRRWGYAALEHAAKAFVSLSSADDSVVVTSDHGMAAVQHLFNVQQVLANAGLTGIASTLNTCLLLNTTAWKDGTIAPAQREQAIERVRAALMAPRTPSGGPIVTKVYSSREEMASFGHDGPGGADMCFDVAPGIAPSDWGEDGVLSEARPPRGVHGLDPTRAEMKAVLLIKGPRFEAGANLGPVRSAVVAPLVSDLLGIQPPRDATFTSPLSSASHRK